MLKDDGWEKSTLKMVLKRRICTSVSLWGGDIFGEVQVLTLKGLVPSKARVVENMVTHQTKARSTLKFNDVSSLLQSLT